MRRACAQMTDMSDKKLVTKSDIVRELSSLGVEPGMVLIVHSSLSSLGWVCGGPQTVIEALQQILGPRGTLVMPTHTSHLTDPAGWQNPPVPESWWEPIRREMPAYDPALTTTRGMGAIPEAFRKAAGVRRSEHPQLSFAAWGAHRDAVVGEHSLEDSMGEGSPLALLYDLDAHVLCLGVGHASNTSLHLAEYRWSGASSRRTNVENPMMVDGERKWVAYEDIDHDGDDFAQLGEAFEQAHDVHVAQVGEAEARIVSQPKIVDFAVEWMERHRT
jgi:aminoglycoside 3-N-acetyltransferase